VVVESLPSGSESYDCDGDGWTGDKEKLIFNVATTVNDQDPCGNNGWPADIDLNAGGAQSILNLGDLNAYNFPLRDLNGNTIPGEPGPPPGGDDDGHGVFNAMGHPLDDLPYPVPDGVIEAFMARFNMDTPPHNPTTIINLGDVGALNPAVIASTSRPPMFGGKQAIFTDVDGPGPLVTGECPWPP